MSKSLLFKHDPIDQPAATDRVERRTWCALQIQIGGRSVSTVWDKLLQSERKTLYLSAFPIAEWVARNWWTLLNQLCLWDTVPTVANDATQMRWIKRHCLRAADSALMLPALYLFHDGQSLRAEWWADASDSMPNMPGEFIASGAEQLDADAAQVSLASFIDGTLERVAGVNDERVRQLADLWRAIQSADAEEKGFCTLAGRMGIDPYDPSEMTEELAQFLEQTIADPENPLVRDLTEVTRPDWIASQWAWLTEVREDLRLRPSAVTLPFTIPSRELPPPQFGYRLAREIRKVANMDVREPLESVEKIAGSVVGAQFRIKDRNHVPGQGIRAIVGQLPSGDIAAVGPQPSRLDNQRFLNARSLYHALVTSHESQRLVTTAYSWEQKASRAFAAELLAPQLALKNEISTSAADHQAVEALSEKFKASTIVIEKQLENVGVPLSIE